MKPTASLPLVVVLTALLAGCGGMAQPKPDLQEAVASPSWPAPPAQARIRYLKSVSGAQDWGITKSLFRRLINALAGSDAERFVRPTGVAEQGGVLYVADPGAHALWILDAVQNSAHKVDRVGTEDLASPVAVALRPDGGVYLADSKLGKVFLLNREGELQGVAARGLERPAGLTYDAARQRLYVADSVAQKIAVFGPDAALLFIWGHAGSGEGEFNHPTHLALDASGTLLVTDALNFRIQAFDAKGGYLWKFGHHGDGSGDLAAPKGVAADREGHIFVVDSLFDAVQVFGRDGAFLLGFGGRGEAPGQFWLPGGLFINERDEIYVADSYNRRVQVFLGGTGRPGAAGEGKK